MLRLFAQRFISGIVTLFLAALLTFTATEILPGDVATAVLGKEATPEAVESLRRAMHLDEPAPFRFLNWIGHFVIGDFGMSLANNRPIAEALMPRFWNTLFLGAYTAIIAVPFALSFAFLTILKSGGMLDRLGTILSSIALALPEFLIGYLLVLFLAVEWQIFPSLANVTPETPFLSRLYLCFLPMLTLAIIIFAHIFRTARGALKREMGQSYVAMAELKGLGRGYIILFHALPNAGAPILYAVALNLAHLILGVVVVEAIFVYPGMGQWMVDAVAKRDLPAVQAVGVIFAAIFILLNAMADLMAIFINPRLRYRK